MRQSRGHALPVTVVVDRGRGLSRLAIKVHLVGSRWGNSEDLEARCQIKKHVRFYIEIL